ncbi:MAG: stage II sporulation protein M [Methanothrix sp.]|uniref:stage II sporulation protein M n=1 Tax=Methanothrix sp. TaxID=90426 RepID=UPI0032AF6CEF|nr:stage II sporulation protein M [Methanothrix sp.]
MLVRSIAYLGSIRGYIAISVVLFFAAAASGFVAVEQNPAIAEEWMKELEMLKWITDLPPLMIMILIFTKNLLACAMAVLLGVGAGVVPMLVAISNGVLVGMVSYQVIQREGVLYLIAGILPHGILELPAVLVSIAIGLRLGHIFIMTMIDGDGDLGEEARTAISFLMYRVAPLLFVAAVIETFITPLAISLASR